ncbi:MAG: HAD family hydrolase [Frankia sp.]
MTRHIVWDWNGTLLDDFGACLAAVNHAVADYGIAVSAQTYHRCFTRPLHVHYARLIGRDLRAGEYDGLARRWADAYTRLVPSTRLREHAEDVLEAVATAGCSQSLLSLWDDHALRLEIRRRGLGRWFRLAEGATADAQKKGPLLAAHLERLGAGSRPVVLVGDSEDDAVAAAGVGIDCVLVTSGYQPRETLMATGFPVVGDLVEAHRIACGNVRSAPTCGLAVPSMRKGDTQ